MVKTNLAQAIADMQSDYARLSKLFGELRKIAQSTKKPIPKPVLESYNTAVKQHMAYANSVFDALRANKLSIRQVVRKDGEPVILPDGKPKTLTIDSPLQPPSFVSSDDVGIAPLIIAAYMIGSVIVVGVTGYVGVKVLEKIQVLVQGRGYEPKRAEDFVSAFNTMVKAGVPAKEAAEKAAEVTKPPEGGGGGTGWLGPISAVAGAGVLAWLFFGHKKES